MHHRPGPDPAVVERAIRALLRVTGEDLPRFTGTDQQKLMAAASLARGRVLLSAADGLVDQGQEEVAGVLVRTLVDTCLTALYILWGGEKAWETVFANHWWQVAKMNLQTVKLPNDAERKRPNFRQLVEDLQQIMIGRGQTDDARTVGEFYSMLFASESSRNAHGGIGAVIGYLDTTMPPTLSVRKSREEPYRAMDLLALGQQILAYLADALYQAFGLPADRLDVARLNYPPASGSDPP